MCAATLAVAVCCKCRKFQYTHSAEQLGVAALSHRTQIVQYIRKNCDKNGFHQNQNLSQEQTDGIKSLKDKVKNNQIYITTSDKTGQLVANTKENYIDRMQEHINNDRVLDWKEKETKENHLNGHAIQMGRWLKIGENKSYDDSVKLKRTEMEYFRLG